MTVWNNNPDPEMIAKARSMCGYIKCDKRIASYLGMPEGRVSVIRANIQEPKENRLTAHNPYRDGMGTYQDRDRVRDAVQGSAMLAKAVNELRARTSA